jgi:hypothetical protein
LVDCVGTGLIEFAGRGLLELIGNGLEEFKGTGLGLNKVGFGSGLVLVVVGVGFATSI